jgi:PAS domain S-box-containing protein
MRGVAALPEVMIRLGRAFAPHRGEGPPSGTQRPGPFAKRWTCFAGIAAVLLGLMAVLVLLGWATGVPRLTSPTSQWPGMDGTTALGLFLVAVALWLRAYDGATDMARRFASALAGLVTILGFLALVQYLYGTDLHANNVLFSRSSGRMAPSEAIGLVLAGGGLLLVDTETRLGRRPTEFLALVLAGIALPPLVAFLYGTLPREDTEISGLSTIAFMLLAAGLLFTRPRRGLTAVVTGPSLGGIAARRLLPLVITLPVVLGGLLLVAASTHILASDWVAPMFASLVVLLFAAIAFATALSFHHSDADRRRAEGRLFAQNAATRALIERGTVNEAIPVILSSFGESLGWDVGLLWRVDREAHVLRCTEVWHRADIDVSTFEARARELVFAPGVATPGQVWMTGEPAWVPDVPRFPSFLAAQAERHGLHAALAFPIKNRSEITGVMEFFSRDIRDLDADLVAASSVLGSQVGEAIERKHSEERLRASEDRFRAVAETATDAMVSVDTHGVITYINPAAERMFGVVASEKLGKPIASLLPDLLVDASFEARRTEEMTARRADGARFPVEASFATWTSSDGVQFVTAIIRDISARKRAEEAVRAARDAAEVSNRELEAFSYSVSHDLQAPLTRIDNFSKAVLEEAGERLDDKSRDYILRTRAAAQRMSRLVDELLELSRASRAELAVQRVDISALARAVASDLRARQPERAVDVMVQEGMAACGDPGLLRGVLENLISNAWKFTSKQQGARIEIGSRYENGATVFLVRDNGAGFDPAYAHLLFAPFQRLHKESEFPGTGVGLAVVQRIIHRHGGRVWADGALDRGATFSFTLPEPVS